MKRKSFKINEEEYQILQTAKLKETKIFKEQIQKQREDELIMQELKITHLRREIKFKQEQLGSGKLLEVHENYIDGKKPKFFIENEIEILDNNISKHRDTIEKIKEEIEKDADSN